MRTIVVYYSRKGSNKFLAEKIATTLNCEITEIRPRLNVHLFMLLGLNIGNRKIKFDPAQYDQIILCGPIWMGKFIIPLENFAKENINSIENLVFVTCCGSSFEMKNEKFGHAQVFKKAKAILHEKCTHCEAFPITLVIPEELKDDDNAVMLTRLSNNNFKGKIQEIFDKFIKKVSV